MRGPRYVAAIDQGTTSTRCTVFDRSGQPVTVAQREHRQIFPRPGWVEHDADEIWAAVRHAVAEALDHRDLTAADLAAIGITNQRETTVVWDRSTGEPVGNAVVWQDMRTAEMVRDLGGDVGPQRFRERTGLPLATYFSGPKLRWLLEHRPGVAERAERGDLLVGTVDSWLIWRLTGGPDGGAHVTDVTNASRTLLMNLQRLEWDDTILDRMQLPRAVLPEIRSSSEVYGHAVGALAGVPVSGALGDQQAALVGQTCFAPGDIKATYGTGSFVLLNTGSTPLRSDNGLLTTVAYQLDDAPAVYALEGSIAVTGALVQWLRDNLAMISTAAEIEAVAGEVDDNGGCYIVPAFSGLFAPHWRSDARGIIAGLTGYVTRAHLARAALEATVWQTREVIDAMVADSGASVAELKVDGGMTVNSLLMQLLADGLATTVVRPEVVETTSLGAAYAAGLAVGYWRDTDALQANWQRDATWTPRADDDRREREYHQWQQAVQRTLGWVDSDDRPTGG